MRTWADDFNTYQEACDFYGCDGPRELAIQARYEEQEANIQIQDEIEAAGGVQHIIARVFLNTEDIPF